MMNSKSFGLHSLQTRMSLWVGLCFILGTGLLIGFSVSNVIHNAEEYANETLQFEARSEGSRIDAEFEIAIDTARTMRQAVKAIKVNTGTIENSRDLVSDMLKEVLLENPTFIGTSTLWEPEAFDGRDAEFANKPGYDETGRLIPYWYHINEQEVASAPLVDYEVEGSGDWYLCPKNTHTECILDPFLYPIQGVDVLMTSFTVPIMIDGTFHGIIGVDYTLDTLQELTEEADLFQGDGRLTIISHSGIIAGSTGQPELVGTTISEELQETLEPVRNGEEIYLSRNGNREFYTPIQVGKTKTPWIISASVPESIIKEEARQEALKLSMIAALTLALGLVAIWIVTGRTISNPIRLLVNAANRLSEGDDTLSGISKNDLDKMNIRQDEIGDIGRAFMKITRYLTERKSFEAGMIRAEKLAGLGTLAAGIAHEINSPLQIITGKTKSLQKRIERNQIKLDEFDHDLDLINRNAWRMARIVRSLLDYARPVSTEKHSHNINTIVENTLVLIEHQLKTWSNITVITNLADEIPPLHCSGEDISRLLINLLSNARDAMSPEGGQITISTRFDKQRNMVLMDVSDTGPGIPADIQTKLFDPFFTTKPIGKGTGLGLSIVHGIVESHGGIITFESGPKKGTTFFISLPISIN